MAVYSSSFFNHGVQKVKPALICNDNQFTFNRKMDTGVTYWRCAKRTCPARITTKDEELLQQTAGHNHPVDAVYSDNYTNYTVIRHSDHQTLWDQTLWEDPNHGNQQMRMARSQQLENSFSKYQLKWSKENVQVRLKIVD